MGITLHYDHAKNIEKIAVITIMPKTIEIPLKPYQKMLLNTGLVALITTFSMIAAGDINNIELWKAATISGVLTFLIQAKIMIEKDLSEDEEGISYTPLMFIR